MLRDGGNAAHPYTCPCCPLAEVSLGHSDIPAAFRSLLEAPLQAGNYQQKFQLLLHLEEIQMEVDIRRYDMQDVSMVQDRGLLVLDVRMGAGGQEGCWVSRDAGITPALGAGPWCG